MMILVIVVTVVVVVTFICKEQCQTQIDGLHIPIGIFNIQFLNQISNFNPLKKLTN